MFGQEECVDGNGDGRKRGAGLGKRLDGDSDSDNPVVTVRERSERGVSESVRYLGRLGEARKQSGKRG